MFKFVVLCAFFAASIAEPEPGAYFSAPFAYSSIYPGSTTITKQSSSVIHPPYAYQAYSAPLAAPLPFAHFIKKRSADPQYLAENYYQPSFYYPSVLKTTPLISTPVYNPLVTPVAHVPVAATHLIKKRSAPLFPYSYYSAPTTYVAHSAPLIATQYKTPLFPAVDLPVTHYTAAHLIKKRSAQLLPASYIAPTTTYVKPLPTASFYSNLYPQYQYSYPNYYPVAASTHFIKKRSAPILPATTYIAPSYSPVSPLYPKFYSGPIYSTPYYNNPFLYSTYIKK